MNISAGTIVQGNWSTIRYKVEHFGTCPKGGWVTGRCPDNPRWTGSFSYLGERVGDEIPITDPNRPKDRLLIVSEPKQVRKNNQMEFDL